MKNTADTPWNTTEIAIHDAAWEVTEDVTRGLLSRSLDSLEWNSLLEAADDDIWDATRAAARYAPLIILSYATQDATRKALNLSLEKLEEVLWKT